jgi:hypothetical protein
MTPVIYHLQRFKERPGKRQYFWKVLQHGNELTKGEIIGYKNQAVQEGIWWLRSHAEINVAYEIVVYFGNSMIIADSMTFRRTK